MVDFDCIGWNHTIYADYPFASGTIKVDEFWAVIYSGWGIGFISIKLSWKIDRFGNPHQSYYCFYCGLTGDSWRDLFDTCKVYDFVMIRGSGNHLRIHARLLEKSIAFDGEVCYIITCRHEDDKMPNQYTNVAPCTPCVQVALRR